MVHLKAQVRIFTRFAMSHKSGKYRDRQWLEARFDLFRDWCVPTVLGQTDLDFEWVIGVDDTCPPDIERSIRELVHPLGSIWKPSMSHLEGFTGNRPESKLISIRLDSDDALASNFVALTKKFSSNGRVLNFFHGARLDLQTGRLVHIWDASGPFISLHSSDGSTVWSLGPHGKVSGEKPVTNVITDNPMWIQTVSGLNLLNEVKPGHTDFSGLNHLRTFDQVISNRLFMLQARHENHRRGVTWRSLAPVVKQLIRARRIGGIKFHANFSDSDSANWPIMKILWNPLR